jgi:casein kinase 1
VSGSASSEAAPWVGLRLTLTLGRKQRKSGSALPNASNQAIVGVSAPSPMPPTSRRQSQQGGGHPFASTAGMHDRDAYDESNAAIPSQAGLQPIAPMNVNGRPGNTAANSQQLGEGDYHGDHKGGNAFLRFISCGCCR